jgi:hypothetical protein
MNEIFNEYIFSCSIILSFILETSFLLSVSYYTLFHWLNILKCSTIDKHTTVSKGAFEIIKKFNMKMNLLEEREEVTIFNILFKK